jgi:phosphate transport system protein
MITEHTDKHYEQELRNLKEIILKMGSLVEEMISTALKVLTERNSRLLEDLSLKEGEVNILEMKIDEKCLEMLALRQPAASDLRFISIGLKISKDLERIGDLAMNISEHAVELNKEPQLKPYIDLPLMAGKAQKMLKEALDSFVEKDALRARTVCEIDDEVDNLNQKIVDELIAIMQKSSDAVSRGTRLIACAKNLERIADHATNIAEQVIFMVQGRDIRHGL